MLKLGESLKLPASAITSTFGILAVRGAGKSNTAVVMAEEMFEAGLPFVVVDPVGAWWGLRSTAEGKSAGLSIPIFGGKHGDVPLERGAGVLVADLIVEKRLSCVLDLSEFHSEGDKKAFLLDFARRLYLKNENPLHLFLEEADDYIPQKPMREEAQLLRAWENIVRRGRGRGLGMTIITQRSAVVNKNVLTQVETLLAMRTTGPQDIAAVEAWIKYNQQSLEILSSLPSLNDGEAWVISPHFLKVHPSRHQIRRRRTFDSGATPKNVKADQGKPMATLADIDLPALESQMRSTIERVKADDPKVLRREIATLRHEIEKAQSVKVVETVKEVSVLKPADIERLEAWAKGLETLAHKLLAKVDEITQAIGKATKQASDKPAAATNPKEWGRQFEVMARTSKPASSRLGKSGLRRIMIALAQRNGMSARQVGVRAGLSSSSGTFGTYLATGRTNGWIVGSKDRLELTEAGFRELGEFDPLPTGQELLRFWLDQLGNSGAGRMLQCLAAVYPSALTKEDLGNRSGLSAASGTFGTYLSKLRTLELVDGSSELSASAELFE